MEKEDEEMAKKEQLEVCATGTDEGTI